MAQRGIFLIGFSGTGKSTVAQLVGAQLGWPAYDLDRLIAQQSGMSIADIFAREGEAGFRARETAALHAVAAHAPFVVATGGGAAVAAHNRHIMQSNGWVVALEARPPTIHKRIQAHLQGTDPDAVRPLLAGTDPLEQIRALKQRRQAAYALADWTVHTDRLSAEQVAAEVIHGLQVLRHAAGASPAPLDE